MSDSLPELVKAPIPTAIRYPLIIANVCITHIRMAIIQRTITPEYTGLPEFDVANVTIANARVDKFEIVFPNHHIEYHDIEKFRDYLQNMALPGGLFSLYNPNPNAARAVRSEGIQFRAGRVFTGKRIYFKPTSAANRRSFAIKATIKPFPLRGQ